MDTLDVVFRYAFLPLALSAGIAALAVVGAGALRDLRDRRRRDDLRRIERALATRTSPHSWGRAVDINASPVSVWPIRANRNGMWMVWDNGGNVSLRRYVTGDPIPAIPAIPAIYMGPAPERPQGPIRGAYLSPE